MRTAIIIAIGFILLTVCLLAPRLLSRPELMAAAAKTFIALWFIAALVNLWIGVSRAGSTKSGTDHVFFVAGLPERKPFLT